MSVDDIFRYQDSDHLGIPLRPIDHQGINDQDDGKAFLSFNEEQKGINWGRQSQAAGTAAGGSSRQRLY
jgi:hypothetical protein